MYCSQTSNAKVIHMNGTVPLPAHDATKSPKRLDLARAQSPRGRGNFGGRGGADRIGTCRGRS
jgi:hypothetical protein